jgi:uncharacterized protein (TIGR02996 family)
MNHERAFLQAIREAPHDDAPRLIYADWLEEQGGAARTARANFIRIQCRLAQLPEDDPARHALEDEQMDLLAEYEDEWTRPLHDIAEDWRFQRGFVEHVEMDAPRLLGEAQHLFDFAPVRSLHLYLVPNFMPHLVGCPQLQCIETLDFIGCALNDDALRQLLSSPHLTRLTALRLGGNTLNTPGMRTLLASPVFARLRHLDLSGNLGIGDNAVRLLARANPANHLEVLNLAGTNLSINGVHALFRSTSLPHLTDLSVAVRSAHYPFAVSAMLDREEGPLPAQLRRLNLSEIRAPVLLPMLEHVLRMGNLQALHLCNVGGGSVIAELLVESRSLANLPLLDLAGNNLGAAGARTLADSPHLTSLTHLNLSHNNIRDSGAKAIAESPHLRRLRTLNVRGNGIGGPGLKALAASANLDQLRTLDLASNFIGADSVRALAESDHLRNLARLDLSDAYLEEESARALASAANFSQLRELLLQKNQLGDGGARALAQSPHLRRLIHLDLNDNRIGKAGAEALAAATWPRMRSLDVRRNVFTDTQEALLRQRFGDAVQL